MGTKIKVTPDKTKVKHKFFDEQAGDEWNASAQGYVKHKSLLEGKPLKGSEIKGKASWKKGRHKISGEAVYRPGSKQGSLMGEYTLSYQEGSKDKTIVKTLDDLLKKTPANRNLRNARAARDSGLDRKTWSGFLTNKQKQMLGIK